MVDVSEVDVTVGDRPPSGRMSEVARVSGLVAGAAVSLAGLIRLLLIPGGVEIAVAFVAVGMGMVVASLLRRPLVSVALGAFITVSLVASPAVRELAFDLVRWDEPGWFFWALALVSVAGLSVVQFLWAIGAQGGHPVRRSVLVGGLSAAGLVALIVTVGNGAVDRAPSGLALPRIEMSNYAYSELRFATGPDRVRWATLVNDTDLPHTFTVAELDVNVHVPSGRTATVRLPAADGTVEVYCAVGDHVAQGMVATARP